MRFFAVLIGLDLVVFVVLGFFFGVLFGMLANLLLRLTAIWNPAYQLTGRMLHIPNLPPRLAKPPLAAIITLSLPALLRLGLIAGLIWLLFRVGLCKQNLACLLLSMAR